MEEVISFDQRLLLALNGSERTYVDNIFLMVTKTGTWVPLLLVLLYILLKNRPWREVLLVVAAMALLILITDRFSSGFCKPFFHRFRPSHEPLLEGLVDLVEGRRGGLYGFISSHAANTAGLAFFCTFLFRRRWFSWLMAAWMLLVCYSRMYLGVHYPGDLIAGILLGALCAAVTFGSYCRLQQVERLSLDPVRKESNALVHLYVPALALLLTVLAFLVLAGVN